MGGLLGRARWRKSGRRDDGSSGQSEASTYWHSRGYGLHSINPFGVSDFLNDKTQNGSLTIEPGEHVRFRYRVIVHPGRGRERLAELYKQYAQTKSSSSNR